MQKMKIKPSVLVMFSLLFGYFWLLWHFSVNIPYTDDFDNGILLAVLNLLQSLHAHQYKNFFFYLFEQHNEHRVVTARILALLQYYAFGQINFKILILLGNLYKVAIFLFIYFITQNRSALYLGLLFLLIFQLADWDASFWAMTAISTYAVVFFAFISLWFVHKALYQPEASEWWFLGAYLMAFLAVFSNGNGMAVFVPGALMLFFARRFYQLFFYVLFGIICVWFYFHGYVRPGISPPLYLGLKNILFAVKFLGAIGRNNFPWVASVVGILAFVYLLQKEPALKRSLFFYLILFILMTALMTSVAREGFGFNRAIESRYAMYSTYFFALLLAWHVNLHGKLNKLLVMLILALFIVNFSHGLRDASERPGSLQHYQVQKIGVVSGLAYYSYEVATEILKRASLMGVYNLPNFKINN